jgi:hypothetical protein
MLVNYFTIYAKTTITALRAIFCIFLLLVLGDGTGQGSRFD